MEEKIEIGRGEEMGLKCVEPEGWGRPKEII
jgi:hypothetical protein